MLKAILTFFLISDANGDKLLSSWCWVVGRGGAEISQHGRQIFSPGSKFSCSHNECVTFISLAGEEKPRVERQHAPICTRHGVTDLIPPFITSGVTGGRTLRLVPGLTAGLQSRVQAPAGSWQQRRGGTCVLGL